MLTNVRIVIIIAAMYMTTGCVDYMSLDEFNARVGYCKRINSEAIIRKFGSGRVISVECMDREGRVFNSNAVN